MVGPTLGNVEGAVVGPIVGVDVGSLDGATDIDGASAPEHDSGKT